MTRLISEINSSSWTKDSVLQIINNNPEFIHEKDEDGFLPFHSWLSHLNSRYQNNNFNSDLDEVGSALIEAGADFSKIERNNMAGLKKLIGGGYFKTALHLLSEKHYALEATHLENISAELANSILPQLREGNNFCEYFLKAFTERIAELSTVNKKLNLIKNLKSFSFSWNEKLDSMMVASPYSEFLTRLENDISYDVFKENYLMKFKPVAHNDFESNPYLPLELWTKIGDYAAYDHFIQKQFNEDNASLNLQGLLAQDQGAYIG